MVTLMLSLLALSAGPSHIEDSAPCTAESCQQCSAGNHCGKCAGCQHRYKDPRGGIMGPMPQTCCGSRYGCYPATERYMNRYPAFHNSYYKRAYNYRNYFDYPWHAELHEPTSLFSYETVTADEPAESLAPVVDPTVQPSESKPLPPTPVPTAQRRSAPQPTAMSEGNFATVKQATTLAPIVEMKSAPKLAPVVSSQQMPRKQPTTQEAESVSTKSLRTLRR